MPNFKNYYLSRKGGGNKDNFINILFGKLCNLSTKALYQKKI